MENKKFELMLDEAQANAALEKGMLYADAFVNKNYLINLDSYPLVELDPVEKSDEYVRLYQIDRIVKGRYQGSASGRTQFVSAGLLQAAVCIGRAVCV